jgi:hypothetical protein
MMINALRLGQALLVIAVAVGATFAIGFTFRPDDPTKFAEFWLQLWGLTALVVTLYAVWLNTEESRGMRLNAERALTRQVHRDASEAECHVIVKRRRTVTRTSTGTHARWDYVACNIGPAPARRVLYSCKDAVVEPVAALGCGHEFTLRPAIVEAFDREMREQQERTGASRSTNRER